MDVTNNDEITSCVKDVEEKYGAIDILLSNAGVSHRSAVMDTITDVNMKLMNVNYFGPVNLVKG